MVRKDVLQEAGFNEPDWSYVYPGSNVHLYDTHRVGSKFVTELNLDKWEEV